MSKSVSSTKPTPLPPRLKLALLLFLLVLLPLAWWLRSRVTGDQRVNAYLDQGAKLLEEGKQREAEQVWQDAVKVAPEAPSAYRALGELYRAQGRLPEARQIFLSLLAKKPQEPHVLCRLAEEELKYPVRTGEDMAIPDAFKAVELEPECVRALTVAGDAALQKGDEKQAVEYLKHAVRVKPEDVPLTLHLINTMLQVNDLAGVKEVAQTLIQRFPGYAQGYVLRAIATQAAPPNSPEALETEKYLRTALKFEPTNALAHVRLGQWYNGRGDSKRALSHLLSAWILNYDRSSLLFQLSVAYRGQGNLLEAERYLKDFNRVSKLENEISALEKQLALDSNNTELTQRLQANRARLDQEKSLFNKGRAALLIMPPTQRAKGEPSS